MKPILLNLGVAICALKLSAAAVATEYLSEVIPIKYAKAADAAVRLEPLKHFEESATNGLLQLEVPEVQRGPIPDRRVPKIIVDERSNSLLVFASRSDMEKVREAVSKLDVALTQVLVEAVIFEIPSPENRSRDDSPADTPSARAAQLLRHGLDWFTNSIAAGKPDRFGFPAVVDNEFGSAIKSLLSKDRTDVNVLQKPKVLTSDGNAASIFVGSVPRTAGIETGIRLTVTPTLAADGGIEMEIELTFDEVIGKTNIPGVGDIPNTGSSRFETSVTLRDKEMILIGGVIGHAEGQTDASSRETFILLQPTILSNPNSARSAAK